ncbi:hypothetical protein GCM10012278_24970 [Nonomuraea glycinis]|uniref:Uncharacterized protein n=1 Tax=Nonomuraea glycinis TaxID=2047744 RepID=A0A918A5C0_9ACTN|nr:hypothetical protein GCM10012278_24970 [Nonomuraea glycinis]
MSAPDAPEPYWEPYLRPRGDHIRIKETSCCGVYEWASQGGQFFVLRAVYPEGYEEAGRGCYKHAREVWVMLIAGFEKRHRCKDPDDVIAEAWWRSRTRLARRRPRPKRSRTSAGGAAPGDA